MRPRPDDSDWLTDLGEADTDLAASVLLSGLAPLEPKPGARERLLAATSGGRLQRFARALADLLDVSLDRAAALLDRALDSTGWEDGMVPSFSALWVDGGPATAGCIRGFTRLEAGATFPSHRHLGDEQVLVLEGAMLDSSGALYLPGDLVPMPAGTEHSYSARAGGTDLLGFAVVRDGIAIGDATIKHRDGESR